MGNLVIATSASKSGTPAVIQTAKAQYVEGQTVNQQLILKAGDEFSSPVGFSVLTLATNVPLQLIAAKGTNPTYLNQTVNQTVTIDDTVDQFWLNNKSASAAIVQLTYVVNTASTTPTNFIVTSVNGRHGDVVIHAGTALSIDNTNTPITMSVLPPTGANIGAVKAGSGVSISADGTISVTNAGVVKSVDGQAPDSNGNVVVKAQDANGATGTSLIASSGATTGTIELKTLVPGANTTISTDINGNLIFDTPDVVKATQLSGVSGASLVGYGAQTVSAALDNIAQQTVGSYAEVRAYSGSATKIYVTGQGISGIHPSDIAGTFVVDANDTASADNGGTLLVDALGRRWKRVISGTSFRPEWFGAIGDNVNDDLAAFQLLANFIGIIGGGVIELTAGKQYYLSQYTPEKVTNMLGQAITQNSKILWLPGNVTIIGNGATFNIEGGRSTPLGWGTSANILVAPLATEASVNVLGISPTSATAAAKASVDNVAPLYVGQLVSIGRVGGITNGVPNTPSQERAPHQFLTISSIDPATSTVVFNEAFIHDFVAAQNLRLYYVPNGSYPTNVWIKDVTINAVSGNTPYVLLSRVINGGFLGQVSFNYATWSFGTSQDMHYDYVYNRVNYISGTPTIESTNFVTGKYLKSESTSTGGPSLGGLYVGDTCKAVSLDEVVCTGFDRSGISLLYGVQVSIRKLSLISCAFGAMVDAVTTYYAALSVGFPVLGTYPTQAVANGSGYLTRNCGNGDVFIDELRITGPCGAGIKTADANLTINRAYIEFANNSGNSAPVLFGQTGFHRADPTYYQKGGQGRLLIRDLTIKTLLGPAQVCFPNYGYGGLFADQAALLTAPAAASDTSIVIDNPQNIKPVAGFFCMGQENTGITPNNAGITSIVGNTINLSGPLGVTLPAGSAIWQSYPNPRVCGNVSIQRVNLDGIEINSWNGDVPNYPVFSGSNPEVAVALVKVPGDGAWRMTYRVFNNSGTTLAETAYNVTYNGGTGLSSIVQTSQAVAGTTNISLGTATISGDSISIPVTYAVSSGTVRAIYRFEPNGSLQLGII